MSDRPWWDDYVWRPRDENPEPIDPHEPQEIEEWAPAPPPISLVECWRCGKLVGENTRSCPYCLAEIATSVRGQGDFEEEGEEPETTSERAGLGLLLAFLGGLLLVSLIQGMLLFILLQQGRLTPESTTVITSIAVVIDSVLVLIAFFVLPRPQPHEVSNQQRALAWILAGPVLILLLGINFAYHQALRSFLGLQQDPLETLEITPWIVLLFCVQPAVVEEVFFRYLALGTLRRYMGLHTAVFVSSMMFGMAHVGQPFGIPVLILVGVGLAYLRLSSGGLALPMLIHFLHNLAVLLLAHAA